MLLKSIKTEITFSNRESLRFFCIELAAFIYIYIEEEVLSNNYIKYCKGKIMIINRLF